MASKERKEKSFNSLKWCPDNFLAKIIGVKFAIIDRLSVWLCYNYNAFVDNIKLTFP